MKKTIDQIIAELFLMNEEDVTDELVMDDVETWDSLKNMELIVTIEENFEIDLTFEEIVSIVSIADIKRILGKKVEQF